MKFRKKPVVIDALQWNGNKSDLLPFSCLLDHATMYVEGNKCLMIPTLEGTMKARIGDWVIRGVKGEFYPCRPEIFEMTYEPYEDCNDDNNIKRLDRLILALEKARDILLGERNEV